VRDGRAITAGRYRSCGVAGGKKPAATEGGEEKGGRGSFFPLLRGTKSAKAGVSGGAQRVLDEGEVVTSESAIGSWE